MSGYRVNAGFGKLQREATDSVGEIPQGYVVWSNDGTGDCIHQLIHRFGAGVDMSINRTRNNNYLQDIGYREFTTATSGMYDLDFTLNFAFVPEMSSWLEYGMMSDQVLINKTTTFVDSGGDVIDEPVSTTIGYAKNGTSISTSPIKYQDFEKYKVKTNQATNVATMQAQSQQNKNAVVKYTGTTTTSAPIYVQGHYYRSDGTQWNDLGTEYNGADMEFHVYSYVNMDGPKYFDMGYQKVNENTTNGGLNEIGLLVGCVIDSFSINYESGSDVQIKASLNCIALNEYIYTTNDYMDYNAILDYTYPLAPLVAGCVSVADSQDGDYTPIAQTDSAGITVSNNITKLGNCLKLTYSSVALGALGIEMNISTYANDPNKFMTYMYGYSHMENGMTYTIAKQPYEIKRMKIRSDNTSSTLIEPTQMLDLNLSGVFVGSANHTYNVDNAIMDEPDLRPRRVQIVTGFITPTD